MSNTLRKILMAEDEADIQIVARLSLEAVGGFEVKLCSSGQEALREAPDFAPDLLLLDMMMPGMDGITTLQEMRKMPALSATPIIFMTAKVQPHEVADYIKLGAIDVISKPFDPMTLSDVVAGMWERHQKGGHAQ